MPLLQKIKQLQSTVSDALDESRNYYVHSVGMWRVLQARINDGKTVSIRNYTGEIVDEAVIRGLAQTYIEGHLASSTFQHFVSLFEKFVFDFFELWLCEYPGSLKGKELTLEVVLSAGDKHEIVQSVVERELRMLAYQRMTDWFGYLDKLVHRDCPSQQQLELLSEVKASRDVLVHNNGIANEIYVDKSLGQARYSDGETLRNIIESHGS
ncbi:MAG: hypothetical protein CMJ78_04865 [Planctomycetaceae bacterium]|nr:hypothetical protein [Planctomycetaceae bacterium]